MNECDIFVAALEKDSPSERLAFLQEACGSNTELRRRVEALLASHSQAGSLLECPAMGEAATVQTEQFDVSTDGAGARQAAPPDESLLSFLDPPESPEALGRLGPYAVAGVVGRGGMGVVLKAHDNKLNRVVAIKVLAAELASNPTAKKRFLREAQAAAAVVHQHVVTIHAVDEDRLPYMVMEYIDGQSLQEKIDREGHLDLREILRIGQQVAAGLAAAHAQGLMHRDVKPANILLENGVERVRISDFGLARAVDDVGMTRTGEVAGTPQYMSPEQAQGLPLDARSDLFSLGSVFYAMCTGRSPFRAESTVAVLRRICDDTPRPIREVNPEIPQWLVEIIDRLLAKQPAARFQSAAEVAELLRRRLAEVQHPSLVGRASGVPTGPQAAKRPARQRHRWAIAASVVLLIGLTLGVTDATGVTGVGELMRTILRIQTPAGTLAVEVDDPDVQVTIEGDGGLSITGAGPQQVHLRPGSYRLQATKDGKPVPLERDLVSISRGDKQIVRVRLEGETLSPTRPAATPEPQAFVVLAGQGIAERKFDTLADAVLAASNGDTIEVRGNGPFVCEPINLHTQALIIRAGEGFRPVFQVEEKGRTAGTALLTTAAFLALEGLELRAAHVALVSFGPVYLANCRIICKRSEHHQAFEAKLCPVVEVRNCEFLGDYYCAVSWNLPVKGRLAIENCWSAGGRGLDLYAFEYDPQQISVRVANNTWCSDWASVYFTQGRPPPVPSEDSTGRKPIRVRAEMNVFVSGRSALQFDQLHVVRTKSRYLAIPSEVEIFLSRTVEWAEQTNLYNLFKSFSMCSVAGEFEGDWLNDLAAWNSFWRLTDTGALEGQVRFQGGNLRAKTASSPELLTPEDFRLRADSAGYRAGPDGKDLGADVDLVGPGAAYERWKKTPEYQQWLTDTGRTKSQHAIVSQSAISHRNASAQAYVEQGASLGDMGEWDQALADFSNAIELNPQVFQQVFEQLRAKGKLSQAEPLLRQALQAFEKLAADSPSDASHQKSIADAENRIGESMHPTRRREAEKSHRRAATIYEELVRRFPADATVHFSLGDSYRFVAARIDVQGTGRRQEHEQLLRQSVTHIEESLAYAPDNQWRRFILADTCRSLANNLVRQKRAGEAELLYRKAASGFELLAGQSRLGWSYGVQQLRLVDQNYTDLIQLLLTSGRFQEAEQVHEQAIALYEKLVAERPGEPYFGEAWAKHQAALARLKEKP